MRRTPQTSHSPDFCRSFANFGKRYAGTQPSLTVVRVIYIATHDSNWLGRGWPYTHQPIETIETLAHFRALPNITIWHPVDGNEASAASYSALTSTRTPSIFALTRQYLPQLESSTIDKALKGGYVMIDAPDAATTLVSTGSECR